MLSLLMSSRVKITLRIEGYLIGNTVSPEAKLLMKRRTGIEVLTYEDLLERTRFKYQEYLDVLVKGK